MQRKKTAAFYDSQKRLATEHAVFNDVGHGEPVREAGNGQGMLLSSFTLLRLGASQQAANDPAKRALLEQKDELEQKIDTLKYQKAAMDPADYKKQLTDALVRVGEGAGGAGQMKRIALASCRASARVRRRRARRRSCRLLGAAQARPNAEAQDCFKRSPAAPMPTTAPKASGARRMGAGQRAVPPGHAAREQQAALQGALGHAAARALQRYRCGRSLS